MFVRDRRMSRDDRHFDQLFALSRVGILPFAHETDTRFAIRSPSTSGVELQCL